MERRDDDLLLQAIQEEVELEEEADREWEEPIGWDDDNRGRSNNCPGSVELQRVVDDPVLVQFIFEDRRYKPDELVGIIKRIKAWGQTSEESDS
jgi:hypothetical protein